MKLGKLFERFPGIANLDINSNGRIDLPTPAMEMISFDEDRQEHICKKVVKIIEHHAHKNGGELVFTYDPTRSDRRIFATFSAPELRVPVGVGVSIKGKKERYDRLIGEALSSARAFESAIGYLTAIGKIEDYPEMEEAYEKILYLTDQIF